MIVYGLTEASLTNRLVPQILISKSHPFFDFCGSAYCAVISLSVFLTIDQNNGYIVADQKRIDIIEHGLILMLHRLLNSFLNNAKEI